MRRYRAPVRSRVLAVVVAGLLLAGCNSGQDPTVEAGGNPSTSSSSATTGSTSSTTTVAPVTPPVSVVGPAERAFLTAVRLAAAADGQGGSRLVFEFDPVAPGYALEYVERPVTEDGSGDEGEVKGEAVLQVRMAAAATARIDGEEVVRTYTGPTRVPAVGAGGIAVEAVDVGDFEGQVTWVVGLAAKAPTLTVTSLTSPPRLVIDVPPATS